MRTEVPAFGGTGDVDLENAPTATSNLTAGPRIVGWG